MDSNKLQHTLAPVFNANSRVLILGSFPSPKSRETDFYYGHSQNRFWRTLCEAIDEPLPRTNQEKRDLILSRGIALWDVIAECEISGAADSSIKNAHPNDFSLITGTCDIRAVFTVGKTAAALYKRFTGADSICLPSPSPANCAVSAVQLTAAFKKINDYLDK